MTAYLAFARKYRPQTFDELIGQDPIAATLKNAIKQNRVAHAYLFTGPRGIGKTSVARIFSKSLNCEKGPAEKPCNRCVACQEITQGNSLDVLEIDGASNRGIDQIRELRENVKFHPTRGQFRIYIIDEVHQITLDGFNALLKTLEEPPPHVKFILATTEPHKVPATISSRCQRFDFHRIPSKLIAGKLKEIVETEKISIKEEALLAIARASQGSMRDAEGLLDQLACGPKGKVALEEVLGALGRVGHDFLMKVAEAIQKKEKLTLLQMVDQLVNEGRDLSQFVDELVEHFRNLAVATLGKEGKSLMDLPEDAIEEIYAQAEHFSLEEDLYITNLLSGTRLSMRRSSLPRIPLEMALVKLARRDSLVSLEELTNRLEALEQETGSSGGENPGPHPEPPQKPAPIKEEAGEISDATFETKWDSLVKAVEAKKKSLGIFFREGRLLSFKGGLLTVGFSERHKFQQEALEMQSNRKLIEETLSETLGGKIRVAFETLKEAVASPKHPSHEPEPIVKFSIETFKGDVVKE